MVRVQVPWAASKGARDRRDVDLHNIPYACSDMGYRKNERPLTGLQIGRKAQSLIA